jgi:ribosome modulation factor
MTDRIVYLVPKVIQGMSGSDLEFVDDVELSNLLAAGWEVSTTMADRKVVVGKKVLKADLIVLKSSESNRGLSIADHSQQRGRGGDVMVRDDFGGQQRFSTEQALANVLSDVKQALNRSGESSHLGSQQNHNLPGLTIISGQMISKAFDVGGLAANRGESADSCPFPPHTEAGQQWLAGYRNREGNRKAPAAISSLAAADAMRAGAHAALQYGAEDQVYCPYPQGSLLRDHWIAGFRASGGRVED